VGDGGDAQERARLPELRDSIAGALPAAWSVATRGRGKLALCTDADIDVKLDGTSGTSALMQHKLGGRVVSQTITVHSVEGSRRLTLPELMATTLHELGHIWCCFGSGTQDGHWSDPPPSFSSVGTISLPVRTPETSWPSERSAASTASPCGSRTSVFGRTSTRATNLTRASFRRRAGSTRDSGPSFPLRHPAAAPARAALCSSRSP